ncbi:MAG: ribosome biogenesis GTP-binding protein YihA/YsxC [Bacteroidota bacterium]
MNITKSEFITSSAHLGQCPKTSDPEFAFIGRSNVGKSSLINMLTGRKALAKVSSKPGKTQLINHFMINDQWYLVDLPGYGWAKVAKTEKVKWGVMIHDYLLERENLVNLFVLVDSRLEPQKIDVEFINWLGEKGIPFSIVFTKCDKQSKNKTESNIAKYRKHLKKFWAELPPIFSTSSFKNEGRESLLNFIQSLVTSR